MPATYDANALDAYWMPFTANRQFKASPRLLKSAKGMYYTDVDDRPILDGTAGLWCCHLGHARPEISAAVQHQIEQLDYAPSFQMGHPLAFEFAARLRAHLPGDMSHVFFTNSGSESVDTALKMALAYHRLRGEGARHRLIGREKGYHGVGFGGISVGGIVHNRKYFGSLLTGVDHMRHTLLAENAFSKGLPIQGAYLAEDLEQLAQLHDAATIAAVIVEPISGSAGVILPPKGYLKRLREICDQYGILLIFDEVITGFGRVGAPFAAQRFDVVPDIICCAKGLTNGAIPMGAVMVRPHIHDTFMKGAEAGIELFHGYTYSGHPVACAAGMAALDVYEKEQLFTRARHIEGDWENQLHKLSGKRHVVDIRNFGLIGAIQLQARDGKPGQRAYDVFTEMFRRGVMIRVTGDTIALSPPLIVESHHIDELFTQLSDVLDRTP